MLDMSKPHRGKIYHWSRGPYMPKETVDKPWPDWAVGSLGYCIMGHRDNTPRLGNRWRTSLVVKEEGRDVETLNSRYTLVGPEVLP
jgi:hypothetical protein